MRENGEWGSASEITALSYVLHCPIAVYTTGVQTMRLLARYGEEEAGQELSILYSGSHYMALQETQGPESVPVSKL